MTKQAQNSAVSTTYRGNDRVLIGFILGLLSFWLFGMTMMNVNPIMNKDLGLAPSSLNLAVSITALFAGMTVVVFGGLADRIGRVKIMRIGFIFAIIGAALVAATPGNHFLTAPMLLIGRILTGLSSACIMPTTLSLIREYWDESGRQRAISLWSMGTWGGTSFAALVGGLMADNLGWRWIFIISTVLSLLGMYLVRDVPESKGQTNSKSGLDYIGMVLFMIFIMTLQLFVSKGSDWGWLDWKTIALAVTSILFLVVFIQYVKRKEDAPFIDLRLFKNKTFTGATLSNFILNSTSGVLIVTMMLMQEGGGVGADTTGLLTMGYGIVIILFIRVGEKLLKRFGPRRPMLWGTLILLLSIVLMLPTNLMTSTYMVLMAIAYMLFGLGLAFYATPSTDAALSNLPADQTAAGSGIYKMASSLGNGLGVAISTAIYTGIKLSGLPSTVIDNVFLGNQTNIPIRQGAMVALLFSIIMIIVAIIVIRKTIPSKK